MKYCPYCGAALLGGAASFCAECGKGMPAAVKAPASGPDNPQQPVTERKPYTGKKFPAANHRSSKAAKRKSNGGTRRPSLFREPDRQPAPLESSESDPRDEGYDGYYDDVLPIDDGQTRDRLDPELIKRAVFIAAGALVIIILAAVLMFLL